jgi:hypothetical protein
MFSLAFALGLLAQNVDFHKEIRPILSNACFSCHGFDSKSRMAGLRLDTREGAFAVRKSGALIVPGKPEASLLLQRVLQADPARRMPPEYSHKSLTAAEKETLRRWIAQGAPWKEHWAWNAPVRPELPVGSAKNPIDRFMAAKLQSQGLTSAPEADRRTLARRVSLDLTGLPPEPADVEAFVNDPSPDSYGKLLERLFASPHYGEHRARYWLDAARYADTHGIHNDNYREMWPYRDWVIQAFNRNMPFDRFTVEQIAGDLMPNRTVEQQIASGFHRCNATTAEGGSIDDEVLAMYAKDRADTTGAVFLGLTIGCATCHDHKFDPITQRDFYAMTAFFRNTTQAAMDGNIAQTPPVIPVPASDRDRENWRTLPERRKKLAEELEAMRARAVALASLDADPRERLAGEVDHAAFRGEGPFSISARFEMPLDASKPVRVFAKADAKDRNRGWRVDVENGIVIARIAGDRGEEATVRPSAKFAPGSTHHIAISHDGAGDGGGLVLWVDGRPRQSGNLYRRVSGSVVTGAPVELGAAASDVRYFHRLLRDGEARSLALASAVAADFDLEALRRYRLLRHDAEFAHADEELARLDAEILRIRRESPVTHVMQEKPNEKPVARLLYRGAYDQPREELEAAVPGMLPPMPEGAPRNRLGLAQWLVAPENPLMARVTVNRFWQELFGTGLVKTPDDFGSQGEAPTHPELLDWLAVEFRESGWDVQKLLRLMLTSNAYKQSAAATPLKLQKDPENRLLSRGPRFRMDAEMVRDYALAASGLLNPAIGGPSVKPYQPEGIWEAVAMLSSDTRNYKRDTGGKLYRRSLYTFWKRSAPPPAMDAFNAPTREQCTVRRERTNTPLQALVTMNDIQFVEAARVLAERALRTADPLREIAGRILARPLTLQEKTILNRALESYRGRYKSAPEDARKLVAGSGEKPADPALDPVEVASHAMLANLMLNLDETLVK